jgi:hypothetical protein
MSLSISDSTEFISHNKRRNRALFCEWQGRRRHFVWLFFGVINRPGNPWLSRSATSQPTMKAARDKNWPAPRPAPR